MMTELSETIQFTLLVMEDLQLHYVWLVAAGLVIAPRLNEKIAHWRHKRDMRRG